MAADRLLALVCYVKSMSLFIRGIPHVFLVCNFFVHTSHECVCVKKIWIKQYQKEYKDATMYTNDFLIIISLEAMIFLGFFLSNVGERPERCEGWRVCAMEVRIFIGTIHLRDDEKYRKVLECFKRRVVHLSNTQQERYARRILAFNALLFFFFLFFFTYSDVPCNPLKFQRYHIWKSYFEERIPCFRMRNHGNVHTTPSSVVKLLFLQRLCRYHSIPSCTAHGAQEF